MTKVTFWRLTTLLTSRFTEKVPPAATLSRAGGDGEVHGARGRGRSLRGWRRLLGRLLARLAAAAWLCWSEPPARVPDRRLPSEPQALGPSPRQAATTAARGCRRLAGVIAVSSS